MLFSKHVISIIDKAKLAIYYANKIFLNEPILCCSMTKIFTFPQYIDSLKEFHRWYGNPSLIIAQEDVKNDLKATAERICRYCGKAANETTFKKQAHIISQMLGRNNLLCDYECDSCNQIFSKYESSFVNWLGITRTLVGTKVRRNNVPEYFSGTGSVQAKVKTIMEAEGTLISRTLEDNKAINIDIKNGKAIIKYKKRPYIPLEVYKVFLKIAFAALPPEEATNYNQVLQMLTSDVHPDLCRFAHIARFQLPIDQTAICPYGILFTKHDPFEHCPKHCFIFYYANQVYSFPLPFNIEDIHNKCYSSIKSYFPPPIFFELPSSNSHVNDGLISMGSMKKVKDDQEAITFEFNPKDMEDLMAFDPVTGESKAHVFNSSEIVGVFIAEKGTELKLPKK
jgi:hypothetical protein